MYISDKDIEFAKRTFSDFVNGQMSSPKVVAAQMTRNHRYLQSEMFKICLEYIKFMATQYHMGHFDARNEWACELANDIVASTARIPDIVGGDIDNYKELMRQLSLKSQQ